MRRGVLACGAAASVVACSLLSLPEASGTAVTPDGAVSDANAPLDSAASDGSQDAGPATYAEVVLSDNPITYLRLEETTGPVLADQKKAHDAIAKGVELGKPGAVGNGVHFTGDDMGWLELGDVFDFSNNVPFTVEVWTNLEFVDQTYRRLFYKASQTAGGWYVSIRGATVMDFIVLSDGTTSRNVATYTPFPLNVWKHLVFVHEGSTTYFYIDGARVAIKDLATNLPDTDAGLFVGNIGTGYNPYRGSVDEIAIYDYALTEARVRAHFQAAGR